MGSKASTALKLNRIDYLHRAINTLAGRAAPDYWLLNLRYGERFQPQGMENLQPLPAGLIGTSPITVLADMPAH